jgi:alanine racemase
VHLEARILQIQTLSKGRTIGYNTTHTCETETRVATVALGYADGVPWQAWGKGAYLIICGKKAPILGRISMDLITVDVSHIPNCTTQDWATVMDKTLTPDYWAKVIQNSSYQVLLNLGNRASRVYVGANSCDLDTPKPHSSCGQKVDERSVY